MKRHLILLAFLLLMGGWPAQVRAQSRAAGSITSQASTCPVANSQTTACVTVTVDPNNGSVGFSIAGNSAGNTFQFEVSDGSMTSGNLNWQTTNAHLTNSTTLTTSTTSTSTVIWKASVNGMAYFRVRCSSYSSGTIVVTINGSNQMDATSLGGGGGGGAPSGPAGGDLAGTYPNPSVVALNSTNLAGLPTGILKNTTGTGVPSIAVGSDLPTNIPIGSIGTAGLSGTSPITVSAAGAVACPTCNTAAGTVTVVGGGSLTSTAIVTGGGSQSLQTPSATTTLDSSGNLTAAGKVNGTSISAGTAPSGCGSTAAGGYCATEAANTGYTPTASQDYLRADSTLHQFVESANGGSESILLTAANTATVTNKTINASQLVANSVTATQLAAQYSKWLACDGKGLGDGLNAIPAGTYLMSTCRNISGVTVTITGIQCLTDNNGTSTLNAAGNTLGALLTGAVTCTTSYAAGTQSANVALTSNDYIKFTFVADGTSKQTDWVVTGTF